MNLLVPWQCNAFKLPVWQDSFADDAPTITELASTPETTIGADGASATCIYRPTQRPIDVLADVCGIAEQSALGLTVAVVVVDFRRTRRPAGVAVVLVTFNTAGSRCDMMA